MSRATDAFFVREHILSCTSCELRRGCRSPVAPLHPTSPFSSICIVGEAPGSQEDRSGEPFVGPAGQLLRILLDKSGINSTSCFYTNTVQCWPSKTPNYTHVESCRGNKWDTIQLAQPSFVIICGSTALSGFRPDLKISQSHGRPLYWGKGEQIDGRINYWADRIILWPIYHPAAALRSPEIKASIIDDLEAFGVLYRLGHAAFMAMWPEDCTVCYNPADHYDEMGCGWCQRHWTKQLALI